MEKISEVIKTIHNESSPIQIQKQRELQNVADGNGNHSEFLEELRKEIVQGFLYSHTRANDNTGKALEVASFCYALIELLNEKGIITIEELDERKKAVGKRLVKKFAEKGMGVVALQENEQDKYTFDQEVEIDCARRIHICHAICCRLDFALSKQDIEEGILKWNLGRPYMIAKDADGYCQHLDRDRCQCTVREHRPVACRGYDCRKDERIWLDFEKGIINPKLDEVFPKGSMSADNVEA
jgi:Fe-S-cluster containining protein